MLAQAPTQPTSLSRPPRRPYPISFLTPLVHTRPLLGADTRHAWMTPAGGRSALVCWTGHGEEGYHVRVVRLMRSTRWTAAKKLAPSKGVTR